MNINISKFVRYCLAVTYSRGKFLEPIPYIIKKSEVSNSKLRINFKVLEQEEHTKPKASK